MSEKRRRILTATPHLVIDLPYPPTVNTYYRCVRGKMLISKRGREFRGLVIDIIQSGYIIGDYLGDLEVYVDMFPPDNRRRDADNICKPLLDAMQHGGLYKDDSQIYRLVVEKHGKVRGGCVVVTVTDYQEWESDGC